METQTKSRLTGDSVEIQVSFLTKAPGMQTLGGMDEHLRDHLPLWAGLK